MWASCPERWRMIVNFSPERWKTVVKIFSWTLENNCLFLLAGVGECLRTSSPERWRMTVNFFSWTLDNDYELLADLENDRLSPSPVTSSNAYYWAIPFFFPHSLTSRQLVLLPTQMPNDAIQCHEKDMRGELCMVRDEWLLNTDIYKLNLNLFTCHLHSKFHSSIYTLVHHADLWWFFI